MKRRLWALIIITSILPAAANADTPKMPQETVQATIDKYGKVYYTEDIKALRYAVEDCYKILLIQAQS